MREAPTMKYGSVLLVLFTLATDSAAAYVDGEPTVPLSGFSA